MDFTEFSKLFGKAIKYQRKTLRGLSQEFVAEKAAMGPRALQYIEAGEGNPELKTIHAIANAIGCRVWEFFTLAEDAPKSNQSLISALTELEQEKQALIAELSRRSDRKQK